MTFKDLQVQDSSLTQLWYTRGVLGRSTKWFVGYSPAWWRRRGSVRKLNTLAVRKQIWMLLHLSASNGRVMI